MWSRIKTFFGFNSNIQDSHEIMTALYQDVVNRNFYVHLFIIAFELVMVISISLRPGGPFVKPRRVAYFLMYLIIILVTAGVMLAEARGNRDRADNAGEDETGDDQSGKKPPYHRYFRIEHAYMAFFGFWGIALTLNDQLGGNGLTVYNYIILMMAVLSMMKPWKTTLLILADFVLLNLLLPYFPDPGGLDHSFNNLMNSLYLSLAGIAIAGSLYNSRIQAKRNEIIIKRQYQQIEMANKVLSREALMDALTGLQNRNSFKKAIQSFEEKGCTALGCIYMDVNGLHELNNHLGHQAGDVMLKTVAGILLNHFKPEEIFRIGGDEFVILCRNHPRQSVAERMDYICIQAEEEGYSLSVGLEWRDRDLNVGDIIQAAEDEMQKNKREYYSLQGGERQMRSLNKRMERIISEKKDRDRFLRVLTPVFKGVYYVDLETDTLRQLFIPPYFKKMLEETDHQFSKALMLYAQRMVEPQSLSLFEQVCDYVYLASLLDGEDIPGFTYKTKSGGQLRLRILKYNQYARYYKETLWIFSDTEADELLSL